LPKTLACIIHKSTSFRKWLDDGNVRQNVGKAQPGSVLRNLLLRVTDRAGITAKENVEWKEIVRKIREWFDVELIPPRRA